MLDEYYIVLKKVTENTSSFRWNRYVDKHLQLIVPGEGC